MKRVFYIMTLLLVAIACEKEVNFACRVVECDVEHIAETSATITATVYASDYGAIEQMGFMVSRSGVEKYEY